jgi:hypothetical protein
MNRYAFFKLRCVYINRVYLVCFFYSLTFGQINAQNAPKYSNEFLNIGVGAKALGMGNAQVAVVNDATSGYWNPAGLLDIANKYEGTLMHAEYLGGNAQYDYIGFATPIDSVSHLGITAIRLGSDNIPDTRFLYDASGNLNYDNIRFFNVADYAVLFSYARKIRKLKLGANFKVIYRNAGNFANAWGFGLDVGAKYSLKNWHFGLMARDVTGTFNAWSHNTALVYDIFVLTGNEIPQNSIEITLPKLILGVAKSFKIKEKIGILPTLDLVTTFDGQRNVLYKSELISIDPSFGIELDYQKTVFLRGGINNFQQIKNFDGSTYTQSQLNFGIGLRIKKVTIDYALTKNNTDRLADAIFSNIFSIKAGFNK